MTTQPPDDIRLPSASLLTSVLLDAAAAAACYLLAYRVRFSPPELSQFLPGAVDTLPLVVLGQLLGLAVAGAYSRREIGHTILRLVAGVALGTLAAWGVTFVWLGREGLSRLAFPTSAGLLVLVAVSWRAGLAVARLLHRARRAAHEPFEDRGDRLTAAGDSLIRLFEYRTLLKNLVFKDLKLKYRGSVFGFLWSLVNPLLMIVVYFTAFTYILRVRTEGFVFFLLLGILAWTFFANSAGMSTGAVVDSGGLIKSVVFPRAILPMATVLFNFAQYLLTILVFLPLMLVVYRVPPAAPMLLFPVFLALQVVFTIGVALLLAAGTAFFRDVRHMLEIALSVLFWTTPIVYQFHSLPALVRTPILLSPVSPFVLAYQEMFYYQQWPDLSLWLVAVIYASGTLALGSLVFVMAEGRFAEQV